MRQRGETGYGKGREAGEKGTGSGSKRYGRREVQTPLSPSTMNPVREWDNIRWGVVGGGGSTEEI